MSKKKVDNHLLLNGELYNVVISKSNKHSLLVNDKKVEIEIEDDINLDPTGDTIQILEIEGEYYADNLGKISKIKIKEKGKDV